MKKLLVIISLVSIASISFAWERMGSDVVFETRPVGVSPLESTEPMVAEEVVEYQPVVIRTYPTNYREYRPVSGVVSGAETAAEGVAEGAAQAVNSVIP